MALVALGAIASESHGARIEQGALILDGVELAPPAMADALRSWTAARAVTFEGFLGADAMLVTTRSGETAQAHRVAGSFAAQEPLSALEDAVIDAVPNAPGGASGLALLVDDGGHGRPQVWYQPLPQGEPRRLTEGRAAHDSPVWAHDGRRLAFAGNGRDGTSNDIYVVEPASGAQPRLVVAGGAHSWRLLDWSPDDRRLLLENLRPAGGAQLYIAEIATGSVSPLATAEPPGEIAKARFAPDGRGVIAIAPFGGGFASLRYIDTATGESSPLRERSVWDVEDFGVSADGRYLAVVENAGGTSLLTVLDRTTKTELAVPAPGPGIISDAAFDASGRRLGFSLETALAPRGAWIYDTTSNALTAWAPGDAGPAAAAAALVTPELVRYPTWDRSGNRRREIPANLYRPRSGGPHPVLILLRSGDGEQFRPGYDPFIQYLVSARGYAVIAPNVRGSAGYGREWLALDDGPRRDDAARDVGSLIVWIGVQPELDHERVVLMGEGHGGYLATASLLLYGERLSGAIDVGGPLAYPGFLSRARSIRKPLLVIQASGDPLTATASQFVAIARAGGSEVGWLEAKDEAGPFRRRSNRDAALGAAAAFLERTLERIPGRISVP